MKIVYVQSYPIYHDGHSLEEWVKLENRDKWMPALTSVLGHNTELWCAGKKSSTHTYCWDDRTTITIRVFKSDPKFGNSKRDHCKEMVNYARLSDTDLFFLKGVDGAVGLQLLKKHILPKNIPFVFIVGGEFQSPYNNKAYSILCETEYQLELLKADQPWYKTLFGNKSNSNSYILPKSVDTSLFSPDPDKIKKWDVISMGRLIPYYKDYSALESLSHTCSVAMIGDGPEANSLKKKMPQITWLGYVPNHKIPTYLVKARCFFHTSLNDFFPRVIPEAAACGLPVIAFQDAIKEDVLPNKIGLRVNKETVNQQILRLLTDEDKLRKMSEKARIQSIKRWNKQSTLPILERLFSI